MKCVKLPAISVFGGHRHLLHERSEWECPPSSFYDAHIIASHASPEIYLVLHMVRLFLFGEMQPVQLMMVMLYPRKTFICRVIATFYLLGASLTT